MQYQINLCAPMFGNNQSLRKGIPQSITIAAFAELFVIYLVYLAINAISHFQNPSQDLPKPSKNDDARAPDASKKPEQKSAFIDVEELNKFFPIYYGYHIVALGIAISYTPYTFTVIVAWLHFLGFLVILGGTKFEKPSVITPAYAWSCLMNLLLIIGGLVGIGWSSGPCY